MYIDELGDKLRSPGVGVRLDSKAMNHLGYAYGLCLLTMQKYANATANMSRLCYWTSYNKAKSVFYFEML